MITIDPHDCSVFMDNNIYNLTNAVICWVPPRQAEVDEWLFIHAQQPPDGWYSILFSSCRACGTLCCLDCSLCNFPKRCHLKKKQKNNKKTLCTNKHIKLLRGTLTVFCCHIKLANNRWTPGEAISGHHHLKPHSKQAVMKLIQCASQTTPGT